MESLLTAGHQETPAKVTILGGPESKDLSNFIQEILDENSYSSRFPSRSPCLLQPRENLVSASP